MEITFKIVLDKRSIKKNGTFPLKLRVFQNRNFKECSLCIDLLEKDWDSYSQMILSSNASYVALNAKVSSTKAKVQRIIYLAEDSSIEVLNPQKIIDVLRNKEAKQAVKLKPDIIQYGLSHIAKLKESGNIGNSLAYKCSISKLKAYNKSEKLDFESVNYKFLDNFNSTLLNEGTKINTISLYLRSIRSLFNKAIKEGVLEANIYPFTGFKIKSERTMSRALTKAEIKKIANLSLELDSKIWHYRNLFLLSYCLIGINFFDLLTLTKENLVDGRIVFRRKKTHKIYSILLQPKAKEILGHYCSELPKSNKEYLLPFVINKNNPSTLKSDVLQVIKNTNDYMKKIAGKCDISKNVTTYYARYTWANMARETGYSKDMIAEALGHEYGNKVTGIYLDCYDNEIIDKMNNKVINAIL